MTTDAIFANDSQLYAIPDILAENRELADLGAALHWLHPESKKPIGDNWSEKPGADFELLACTYKPGNNIGIRLGGPSLTPAGCLMVLDLDIRDESLADVARATLLELCPKRLGPSDSAKRVRRIVAALPFCRAHAVSLSEAGEVRRVHMDLAT